MPNDCELHLNMRQTGSAQDTLRWRLWSVGLIAAGVLIAWPWLSGRVTIPWDSKAQFLPQVQFLAQALSRGESPFWTPNIFVGHPQIADAQSLIFSPPYLLLALIDPTPNAWAADVTLYVSLIASALAFFGWITGRGVTPLAGFIAALAFAFGASMAWRVQHTGQVLSLAYLPFVLLFLDRAMAPSASRAGAIAGGALAGLFGAFLVLGRDQVGLICVYLLIAYVAWTIFAAQNRNAQLRRALAPLTAGGIVGAALIALPILMTVLLAQQSNRPAIDLEGAGRGSLHPALFLTLLAPDVFGSSGVQAGYWGPPSFYWKDTGLYIAQNMGQLYLGAAAVLALVWGCVSGYFLKGEARFFLAAFLATAIYALGWYTPVFALAHAWLPGVNLYRRPADATFVLGFLGAVLAGLALDALLAKRSRPETPPSQFTVRTWAIIGALLTLAFAVMAGLAWQANRLADAAPYIALPIGLIILSGILIVATARAEGRTRTVLASLLAAVTVGDLAYSNGPGGATALPPVTYDALDPSTQDPTLRDLVTRVTQNQSPTRRDRVELVGLGFHWPNVPLAHNLEHTLGYNPVRLVWINQALGANDTTGLPDQKTFSPLYPSYRSPMANLLGLRFIATSVPVEEIDKTLKPGDLPLLARTPQAYIYENVEALPRVLFATKAVAADWDSLIASGRWPQADVATTVALAQADVDPAAPAARPGRIAIAQHTTTKVTLTLDSPDGGYAVLNDAWHPWWFAELDGRDVPVLRANAIFRAVKVPAGAHTLVFEFRPLAGALRQLQGAARN